MTWEDIVKNDEDEVLETLRYYTRKYEKYVVNTTKPKNTEYKIKLVERAIEDLEDDLEDLKKQREKEIQEEEDEDKRRAEEYFQNNPRTGPRGVSDMTRDQLSGHGTGYGRY